MNEFKLPDLGEGIHEGELLKWYVNVGDDIKEDDPLCDVETDKAAVTIPSPFTGKVLKLNGNEGDTLHVGNVIAVVGGEGDSVVEEKEVKEVAQAEPLQKAVAEQTAAVSSANLPVVHSGANGSGKEYRVAAAPATRRLARELKIDINQVQGSGPGGRVTPDDVKSFASGGNVPVHSPKPDSDVYVPDAIVDEIREYGSAPIPFFEVVKLPDFSAEGPVEKEAVRSIRRKVAIRTTSSMVIVPHVAHMDEIDVTELEEFRTRQNQIRSGEVKLTLLPFVIKAVSAMLKKYPMFNASLDPHKEEIIYKKYYNIGFAADTPRGLIVPVVKEADRKSIMQLAGSVYDLATQGREGTIGAEDMRQGTFSITNVGPLGGTGMIPTINYPEVAIFGMARVQEKPVVRDGEIVIRKILPVTLAFDHRVADGAQAANFVTGLGKLLADPSVLLLES